MKTHEDYKREAAERDRKGKVALEKFVKRFKCPEGYTAEWVTDMYGRGDTFKVHNATESFSFYVHGDGTTSFDTAQGRRTFDRRGVESSFYWQKMYDGDKQKYDPNAIITRQLERIGESRARMVTAVAIPEIGFTIQPEELTKLRATLRAGGHRSFAPSGFGTGYVLTTKRTRFSKVATAALAKFLDVGRTVYVEKFDHD
jgi:hypothetical protein